jgi:hypothetical protein
MIEAKPLAYFINRGLASLFLVFICGCAARMPQQRTFYFPEKLGDIETRQKAKHILEKVEETAREYDLDYLGRNTMSESVWIMELGHRAIPVLVEKLKESSNWKFSFWIVDILGYIKSRENILPLVEVIEDDSQTQIVRLRACESLREMRFNKAIEHLVVSADLVKNYRIREEINKTIEFLR